MGTIKVCQDLICTCCDVHVGVQAVLEFKKHNVEIGGLMVLLVHAYMYSIC